MRAVGAKDQLDIRDALIRRQIRRTYLALDRGDDGTHLVLNPQKATIGAFEYTPFPLQAEVSLEIGWFTPI